MKFACGERRRKHDDHLIPLINVVFLMLIFFMLIGRIAAPPDLFQIRPPVSQIQQRESDKDVTILVSRDGLLAVDDTPVTLETLIPALQLSLDNARRKQGGTAGIRVKADAALTAGQLMSILKRLRDSGNAKVRLLTWSDR